MKKYWIEVPHDLFTKLFNEGGRYKKEAIKEGKKIFSTSFTRRAIQFQDTVFVDDTECTDPTDIEIKALSRE